MFVGVDIGGTFTDFVLSVDGRLKIHKVLSTPHDPAQAMLAGLADLSPQGLSAIAEVSHGSTVATNAILERKGAPTALITTQGFRDILAIGRQNRPALYALQPQLPPPLIPRRWCYEVPERLDHTGEILTPLDMTALDAVLDDIAREGIESVAICFLYSYLNPAHERAVRARILERGLLEEWQVALSSEVLPEFREYERASTVALEAYVRPVVSGYLRRLEEALCPEPFECKRRRFLASPRKATRAARDARNVRDAPSTSSGQAVCPRSLYPRAQDAPAEGPPETCSLRIMKSDGGVMNTRRARRRAIHTALSGPAAGVIGGFRLAQQAGYDAGWGTTGVITLDMGGTSTDVSLCPGEPIHRAESEIGGLPLRTRLLDIETIGAGGGSIARLDAGGVLRVGPKSAGADPGPIAYGRGGQQATVTDANAVLGRLEPDHFLGGEMTLHLEPARAALESLADEMGFTREAAALGVVDVANANIDRALRRVSVARGYDPRDFTLVAFGGAGPLHACEVAERLEIPRVLIPRYPGVLCALGLLMADVVLEASRSVLGAVTAETPTRLQAQLDEMIAQARADLSREGFVEDERIFNSLVDARYEGQSYELTIPFTEDLVSAFHTVHAEKYGHRLPERTVEVVNLRLQATGLVEKPTLAPEPLTENDGVDALLGHKMAVCDDQADYRQVALYERRRLRPGATFAGPALVFQMDSTVFIPPGWSARVDSYRNLLLE